MSNPTKPPVKWTWELQQILLDYIDEQIEVRTPRCFDDLFEFLSEAHEDDDDFQGFDVSSEAIERHIRIVCNVGYDVYLGEVVNV